MDKTSRLEKLNILGSIRAKYVLTFALLISIGCILLSLIVSSLITGYTVETRRDSMDETAQIVYSTVRNVMRSTGGTYNDAVAGHSDFLSGVCSRLGSMNGTVIVLADSTGSVLLSSELYESDRISMGVIPSEAMRLLRISSDSAKYSSLSGFYPERCINYCMPVTGERGEDCGIILVSAPVAGIESFMTELIETLVISLIWITLAAVLVSIFISERIVTPLKIMKKAAKSYSQGNFDVTVPETGVDNEVAEVAKAMNAMSRVIKEKEVLQRNFLGSVSHDMRTPMTSIAGFVDGILDGTIPQEKQEYYLKIVSAETHRLSRLVNSLLDITRIQSGERKFNMEDFDICELLRLVLISMEAQIDAKHLMIEFEPCSEKCIVNADRDGIHQVAYNLIHNAIKFTEDGGKVKIGVEKSGSKKYLVSVYNTGKGIKKEEIPYVFDRFYKSDPSRGLDKSGAGLGLFIVKTILASHNQSVSVRSEENSFCEFSFTLSGKN